MSIYRITTRFDLNDERQRKAADYLKGLRHGEVNRFMVEAVLTSIGKDRDSELIERLRRLLQAEHIPASSGSSEAITDNSVLDDLEMFE